MSMFIGFFIGVISTLLSATLIGFLLEFRDRDFGNDAKALQILELGWAFSETDWYSPITKALRFKYSYKDLSIYNTLGIKFRLKLETDSVLFNERISQKVYLKALDIKEKCEKENAKTKEAKLKQILNKEI